jgi:hypothetical protein
MKWFLAALLLTGCAAQAGAQQMLEVENQSDHAMTGVAIWEIRADGSVIDDNLGGIAQPLPGHSAPIFELPITRCLEHLRVDVTYDDGHEATQEINLCQKQSLTFRY